MKKEEIESRSKNLFNEIFKHIEENADIMNKADFTKCLTIWLADTQKINVGDIVYPRHLEDSFEYLLVVTKSCLFHIRNKTIVDMNRTFNSLHMEYKKSKYQNLKMEV